MEDFQWDQHTEANPCCPSAIQSSTHFWRFWTRVLFSWAQTALYVPAGGCRTLYPSGNRASSSSSDSGRFLSSISRCQVYACNCSGVIDIKWPAKQCKKSCFVHLRLQLSFNTHKHARVVVVLNNYLLFAPSLFGRNSFFKTAKRRRALTWSGSRHRHGLLSCGSCSAGCEAHWGGSSRGETTGRHPSWSVSAWRHARCHSCKNNSMFVNWCSVSVPMYWARYKFSSFCLYISLETAQGLSRKSIQQLVLQAFFFTFRKHWINHHLQTSPVKAPPS